jgi:hypothetical protein
MLSTYLIVHAVPDRTLGGDGLYLLSAEKFTVHRPEGVMAQ